MHTNTTKRLVKTIFLPLVNCIILGLLLFQTVFAGESANGKPNLSTLPKEITIERSHPSSSIEQDDLRVQSSEQSLTLELVTPEFVIEEELAEGKPCQVVRIQDYGETDLAGYPRLPMRSVLVGIPVNSDPSLAVLEVYPIFLDGHFDLCPVSSPIIEQDLSGEVRYLGDQAVRDHAAYSLEHYWPATEAELASTGFVRNQRIAQVSFHPFQYNPVSGELRYFTKILVQLNLAADHNILASAGEVSDEGAFESILSHNLVNYSTARLWRSRPEMLRRPLASSPILGENTFKLSINQDGVYQVSFTDLETAGATLTGLDPHTFQLFNNETEAAIQVPGEDDGSFDPIDKILFYGQKVDTKYASENVYFLTWGVTTGRRMEIVDGTPQGGSIPSSFLNTIHREQNVSYFSNFPSGSSQDVRYWDYVYASTAPASKSFTVNLNHISTSSSETAMVRGLLKGHSATPRHHTRVYINDHLIDDATWNVLAERSFEVSVPQTYLVEGANTIKVECPRDGGITKDIVLVNWFEIDYWDTFVVEDGRLDFASNGSGALEFHLNGFSSDQIETFDITDPLTPMHIVNTLVQSNSDQYDLIFEQSITSDHWYIAVEQARLLSPSSIVRDEASDLQSTANGADYIMITHKDFYAQILPLAEHRAASGLRTMVVKVDDVYDEFNGGVVDPSAIHDFLTYAFNNWQSPAPLYVLLVGDGNYDPRNYMGTGETNYIPAYLERVDSSLGETASDNRYVTVSGSDNLPDLFLGRFPVKTSAEASVIVSKILAYEENSNPATWSDDVLFVTDNADSGGNFPYYSDLVVNNFLPTGYTPEKVYYGVTHTVANEAKSAILNGINQGKLIVNYVGHGAVQSWASESLLSASSLPSMTNAGKLPFVAALACLTGSFHYPSAPGTDNSSIAEKLLRAEDKGSIASWGSSGMGLASGQDYLNRGLYQAIFYEGETKLGAATTQAKLYLNTYTSSQSGLIDIFTLFGDPAMSLNVLRTDVKIDLQTQPELQINNGETITYTMNFSNQGETLATHVTIDNLLPDWLFDVSVSTSGASVTYKPESQYSWDVQNLAPGQGGTITVTGVMQVPETSLVETQAHIATAISETDHSNNSSETIQTVVLNPTDLSLINLEATREAGYIQILWQAEYPIDNLYFNVYRSTDPDGEKIRLNDDPIPSQSTEKTMGERYSFQDTSFMPGTTYYYWVESSDPYQSQLFSLGPVISSYQIYLPTVVR